MSNNEQIIREALNATTPNPEGYPEEGLLVHIDFLQGFEKFGAYETWGSGWRVIGRGKTVENKKLNAAVNVWALRVWEAHVV